MKGRFLPLLLFLSIAGSAPAQASSPRIPRGYVCRKSMQPLVVDGFLDEPDWRLAPWSEDFVDIEGAARARPRFRTRMKMLWDEQYLYIGAELVEPHVWATLKTRDTVIFNDNDFEVFIDPNGDNLEYYEMEMNALNTVWDLFLERPYRDGGHALNSWDIVGLRTAVHVRGTLNDASDIDTGWTVEIAMPWKSLAQYAHRAAPPVIGDQWRINFSRVEWQVEIADGRYRKLPGTREDNWVWSPQGVIDMHQPEMWGYVQFGGPKARQAEFRADPAWGAKRALMDIYHAEMAYQQVHGHWAPSIEDLGLRPGRWKGLAGTPAVSLTESGYIATATVLLRNAKKQTWFTRQDSRLWPEQ
jgi:hypothetical protein